MTIRGHRGNGGNLPNRLYDMVQAILQGRRWLGKRWCGGKAGDGPLVWLALGGSSVLVDRKMDGIWISSTIEGLGLVGALSRAAAGWLTGPYFSQRRQTALKRL
jgi:hypothetical protein